MSFIDALLLDKVAYGFTGGPSFDTTTVRLRSGYRKDNANRELPVHRYSAPFNNISESDYQTLLAAFMATQGAAHSFRFFDRNDYKLEAEAIGTATGAVNQTLQLTKAYTFGATTLTRNITKPINSATAYGRGVQQLGAAPAFVITEENLAASPQVPAAPIAFSLDYATGIVTFTGTAGYTIRASGWFDVPVHFMNDELPMTRSNINVNTFDVDLEEDLAA